MEREKIILFAGPLQLREALPDTAENDGEEGKKNEPRHTVSGYAIRFNEPSVRLYDTMTEYIAPTCVTPDTLRESDVKMTLFHNREKLLARWNKGEGSLRLAVDPHGVSFEFDVPDTELGRFCLEGVRRGDLSGCSFTFVPLDYTIAQKGEDDVEITHTRFAQLLEMTIGTDPAYPTTTVGCREFRECVGRRLAERKGEEALRREAEALRERKVRLARALASL